MLARNAAIEVVASAGTGEQAVALFCRHRPDVTLMDLQLPVMSGVDAIRAIRRHSPDARIIVLTMFQGEEDIYRALEAGAATYLLKDSLTHDLSRTVVEVYEGTCQIPTHIRDKMISRGSRPSLTSREIAVVELIARGMRNKEIGAALGVTEETAKVHVKHLLTKLDVNDRSAAVTEALRRGIIHLK
jgi:two-component system NarL family response regulator